MFASLAHIFTRAPTAGLLSGLGRALWGFAEAAEPRGDVKMFEKPVSPAFYGEEFSEDC